MGSAAPAWSVPSLPTRRMSLATNPGLINVTVTPVGRSSGVMASASARNANLLIAYGDALGVAAHPATLPTITTLPLALLDIGERGVDRAQHAEDIGLELAAVIIERQIAERPHDTEAGVRDDHIQRSPAVRRF